MLGELANAGRGKEDADEGKDYRQGQGPPASGEPKGIEAAMAAPGAIEQIDWNTTSLRPMALRCSSVSAVFIDPSPLLRSWETIGSTARVTSRTSQRRSTRRIQLLGAQTLEPNLSDD